MTQKHTDSKPGLACSAFLPLLIQNTANIPGSSESKQISRCRARQECHRGTTTWAGSQVGKKHGAGGSGIWVSQGGSRAGWGRCRYPPVRFPLCILVSSCASLTSLLGAIIDLWLCYCWPLFYTGFLIDTTENKIMISKEIIIIFLYFSWDSNPGIQLCTCFCDPGNGLLPGKPGRRVMKLERNM